MPEPASAAVHLIVFSKDRPLQLHGMLTSVFRHWRGAYRVTVLARTEGSYFSAYEDVWREFRDRDVVLLTETDFPEDLSTALAMNGETTPYVCFGCDDVVYTLALDVSRVADTLRVNHGLLGYSLRLGLHTQADTTRFMSDSASGIVTMAKNDTSDARQKWRRTDTSSGYATYQNLGTNRCLTGRGIQGFPVVTAVTVCPLCME